MHFLWYSREVYNSLYAAKFKLLFAWKLDNYNKLNNFKTKTFENY